MNPCKDCLIVPICEKSCEELGAYIHAFMKSFDPDTPAWFVAKKWIKEKELRPRAKEYRF